jgi:2-polyprenyl-6-methoxyphenol hydroxylase-like FAD-dependent oxidoreductase
MMKIVISGGGIVGLTLARFLRLRGFDPVVLERMPAGRYVPRGFMLGYQGFPLLQEIGIYEEIREAGWDIAPRPDGNPVAICVDVGKVIAALGRDVPVAHEESVVELVREGDRVVGVVTEGPAGRANVPADLVVACDGIGSPVRTMAGLEARFIPVEDAYLNFMSPAVIDRSFHMIYLSDGGQVGLLGWPQGSAGWRSIDRMGEEAALAPGLEALKRSWARLMPEAEPALAGLTSMSQVRYGEPSVLRVPQWWTPGVVLIGDASHFFGPETGVGAGLGLGDAHALAEAVRQNPDDPDAACRHYAMWREPVIRPYEAMDPAGQRRPLPPDYVRPDIERWPPVD